MVCPECDGRGEILDAPNNVLDGQCYWTPCPECGGSKMDDRERYETAGHAVQTGVAYDLERDPTSGTPKHLRVGINMAMSDQAGLVTLLIEKGVFTLEEYLTAVADSAEDEAKRYEQLLSNRYGKSIKLR